MDTANNVIDSRLSTALGQYFNGVSLRASVGYCAILSGVRKQNGAPVDIYTPSFTLAQDEAITRDIGKAFTTYEKLTSPRLQATERLLTTRTFKKSPALAVLSCPEPVFNEAFDTRPIAIRLQIFDEILEGLAALHGAGLVHGNLSDVTVRRETADSTLRLCDLTFSGDRATTVTAQPAVYQSRNVINTAQPRSVDDVHAAGMLGYRILLGENGPATVLGGADDTDSITAAILGEPTTPPTAERLFPEGHPSAEQIARLLARMTGRLANTAPYSNADAARRAFRTVLDTPSIASQVAEPQSATVLPQPVPMPSAAAETSGISRATALVLFAGFLVSTGAAVYYFIENDKNLNARFANAQRAATLKQDLSTAEAQLAAAIASQTALRDSDRLLTQATYAGAAVAGPLTASALADGVALLTEGDAAFASADYAAAQTAAQQAGEAARNTLSDLEMVRANAADTKARATEARGPAQLAARADDPRLIAAFELQSTGTAHQNASRYVDAAMAFDDAREGFATLTDTLRQEAETAKSAADTAMSEATSEAAKILGGTYLNRGTTAFEASAFADAAALFTAASEAFTATRTTPDEVQTPSLETTTVQIGDTPQALAAAVQLCLSDAPIAAANCPATRPVDEAQRSATLTPYSLDATEVSAADFARFVSETGYQTRAEIDGKVVALTSSGEARLISGAYTWATPGGVGTSFQDAPENPVTNIALTDATAYCDWAGGRLPTEAEWESAGRTIVNQPFPWGAWDAAQPIWRGAATPAQRQPQPVAAAGGATAAGHLGMSGNAREWVLGADGPVVKGGSWNTANPADLRLSARLSVPDNAPGVDFGFRCARDAEVSQ